MNCGLLTEANEIENRIKTLIAKHGSLDDIPEEANFSLTYYEELIKKRLEEKGNSLSTKSTELLINVALNTVFKEIKTRKACMHCKTSMYTRIQALRNRIMMVTNQLAARDSR